METKQAEDVTGSILVDGQQTTYLHVFSGIIVYCNNTIYSMVQFLHRECIMHASIIAYYVFIHSFCFINILYIVMICFWGHVELVLFFP